MKVHISAIVSQLFQVIILAKCVLTILELNGNQRFRDNIDHFSSYAHVVHTTAKHVISRRRNNENVCDVHKNEKFTCEACKTIVFHCQICKFVTFSLLSTSSSRKLSNIITSGTVLRMSGFLRRRFLFSRGCQQASF